LPLICIRIFQTFPAAFSVASLKECSSFSYNIKKTPPHSPNIMYKSVFVHIQPHLPATPHRSQGEPFKRPMGVCLTMDNAKLKQQQAK